MPNYSDADIQEARYILERLLARERMSLELDETVVVSDLEADAAEFELETELLAQAQLGFPALRSGDDYVPVALSVVAGAAWPNTSLPGANMLLQQWVSDYMRPAARDGRFAGYELIAIEHAQSLFVRRATEFLATRIAAVRELRQLSPRSTPFVNYLQLPQRTNGLVVSTPGCNFSVSSASSGLRVFWSGAYRVSPNYFNHPTTPTTSILQSGTYVFGVDGGAYGSHIQWDLAAVITLPGTPSVYLNF